jgi:hypothetical protein
VVLTCLYEFTFVLRGVGGFGSLFLLLVLLLG